MDEVKITERGWIGHHILADRCLFRRNTLIEYKNIKIVISSVGNMVDIHAPGWPNTKKIVNVGPGRMFETLGFMAKFEEGYWDANVQKSISLDYWCGKIDDEGKANNHHDASVKAVAAKLLKGEKFKS